MPMRGKKLKCSWRRISGGFRWIDFTVMLDVLEFSLDNAIFRMKDGRIVRQRKGIPMGDALSPAMTIGTCGWMEREWMNGLDVSTKGNFKAKRYMDDILFCFCPSRRRPLQADGGVRSERGSQIWAVGPRAPNGGRAARKFLAFERA